MKTGEHRTENPKYNSETAAIFLNFVRFFKQIKIQISTKRSTNNGFHLDR